jgi:thiamine biosynthesis protein ThiS
MAAITILLNGESHGVSDGVSLDRLLDIFSLPKQRVAIELNSKVIRRSEWPETLVHDSDRIEVVHFVGGG